MAGHKKLENEDEKPPVDLEVCEIVVKPKDLDERGAWGNKVEYLLACIGLAVGLGNVWRFPYLCHKHGGGAFLIPYFICLIFEGVPLMYLEMAVGQFFRSGSVNCWSKIHPMLRGIGVGSVCVSMLLCLYYVIIIARCFLYFFNSFTGTLPFTQCVVVPNMTTCCEKIGNDKANFYYWNNVLNASSGFNDVANFNWALLGCLALAWVICYICVFKGVESSGKAVYFTATFPYVCLVILFFRGVTLPGALEGIMVYIKPDFSKLWSGQVWLDAATQIFFSLSLGFGALIAFASYVPYKNNVGRDAMIVSLVNCGTSIFAGFVIYSILGFRQHKEIGSITDVSSGSGLAFVAISEAVSEMSAPYIWSILFFTMLILLGLDSEFGTLEGAVTPLIVDMNLFPKVRKEIVSGVFAGILFLFGIGFCSGGGEYMIIVFDTYGMNIPILILALSECLAVGWVFGTENMSKAIEDMQGTRPNVFFTVCWKYISPFLLIVIFCVTFVQNMMTAPEYPTFTGCADDSKLFVKTVTLPMSAQLIGWVIVIGAVIPIPIFAFLNRKSESNILEFLWSILYSVVEDRKYDMESLYHRPGQPVITNGYDNGDTNGYNKEDRL